MAYQITFWKSQDKSDIELLTIRLKARIEADNIVDSFLYSRARNEKFRDMRVFDYSQCSIITLDRTDRQSPITKELWKDSNYRDLNER
jgi:hypothetical protein